MPKSLTSYVTGWCQEHGWTDLFVDHCRYWAFPPGAAMPLPIPTAVFENFKQESQLDHGETVTYGLLLLIFGVTVIWSWLQQSPMPLVFAFCMGAIAVARFDKSL